MILAVVAVLPLFALVLYEVELDRRQALEHAREDSLNLARARAAAYAGLLNRTQYLLSGFAARGIDGDSWASGCPAALARIVETHPVYHNALIADASGDVRCSVRPLAASVNLADRDYFRRALEQDRAIVSGLLTGRVSGVEIIVVAQPVRDASSGGLALLMVSLEAEKLSSALRPPPVAEGTVLILADADGHLVARWPDVAGWRGRIQPGLAAQKGAIAPTEGFIDVVGLDGRPRVAGYAKLRDAPESPLYVVAGVPREHIERGPRAELLRDLAVITSVLLLALAFASIGAQRLLVGPLRRLGQFAGRYEAGDLSARSGIDHDAGEIGALARRFDQLAAHNQRVTRALRALSAGNRTLLREKSEEQLLGAMCRVAVEHAGYRVAFVNYAGRDEGKSVRTVARAGRDEGFIDSLGLTWADSERGRGSVGTAIRSGKPDVVRSMASDVRFAPWRDAAVARGFGSVVSLPLVVENEVIGTLTMIAPEPDAFDGAELELLEEMAADLSFGIGVLRSSARRIEAEGEARRAATHDPVTRLPGRIPFVAAVESAMRRGDGDRRFAVLVAVLPDLQPLQESLGYEPANAAALEAVARLRFAMLPATHLGRLSPHEFALLVPAADGGASAELASRLNALFEAPVEVAGIPVDVRVRFGATLFPDHGDDAEALVRRAGIAAAEAARRDAVFVPYRGATERENPARLALAGELRRAIQRRELLLHLQAKVDLRSGMPSGAEALVRWRHPDKGMVQPMQFVPVAEQTGLIRPLTDLVLELAVEQLRAWRSEGRPWPIAVNLSQRNLHEPRLVERIGELLSEAGVPAERLELEITESVLAEDPEAARAVLGRLRALGCKLYIDDFGTGYSSLSHLVALPLDALKIDRSFVRQMTRSREARSVVAAIILMAKELRLRTVAEGVETAEDVEVLRALGCDEAQGYVFARPVPPEEFLRAAAQWPIAAP